MKWFDKWFAKKVKQAWENRHSSEMAPQPETIGGIAIATKSIDSHGMNFTVYRANGGHVIETRMYDKRVDRNNNGLHIITDDKDLGQEIGRIITFEHLRT